MIQVSVCTAPFSYAAKADNSTNVVASLSCKMNIDGEGKQKTQIDENKKSNHPFYKPLAR